MIAEPMRSHLHLDLVPVSDDNFVELTKCNKFVKVIVDIDTKVDRGHLCRFNCVEVVKSLIGMKSFWTFTPYQLYKKLRRIK